MWKYKFTSLLLLNLLSTKDKLSNLNNSPINLLPGKLLFLLGYTQAWHYINLKLPSFFLIFVNYMISVQTIPNDMSHNRINTCSNHLNGNVFPGSNLFNS